MKSLLRRRPSPAMVIALIALFVSLSGVSYGVATGFIDSREIKNNEIRSLDIRNNQVRSIDLRNNEVRGRDIRNSTIQSRDIAINGVTGDDVKEDTLAQVPSALLADSATTATAATSAGNVDTLKLIPPTVVAEGGNAVALATHGPLTLSAVCSPNTTATRATIRVSTTEDNSAAVGDVEFPVVDAAEGPRVIGAVEDPAGDPRTIGSREVAASAPSGKAFTGQIVLIPDAAGAGSCTFYGHLALEG